MSEGVTAWWGRWRFAARLARREVRRRPGRTVLVMLLVAAPVLAMTAGDVIYRTQDDPVAAFERQFGQADLALDGTDVEPGVADITIDDALDRVPPGSRHVDYRRVARAPLRSVGGASATADFTDLPLADPITDGIVDLSTGRAPEAADEAVLSPGVAERLGVGVGDELALAQPERAYEVVGLGRQTDDLQAGLVVVGSYSFDELVPGRASRTALVAGPPGDVFDPPAALVAPPPTQDRAFEAYTPTFDPFARFVGQPNDGDVTVRTVAWGWVTGVIGLAAVGIIIAAAFATSARRQLLTLGQLSSNGADQALLRRTLALQGAWSGLAGSVLGVAGALVLLGLARDPLQHRIGRTLGPWVLPPAELGVILMTGTVAATIAAYLPARGISRVPVLSALSGRRPLHRVPRWLVPVGIASFSMGTLLLLLAALASPGGNGDLLVAVAVLGGFGVLAGACCVSPGLVAVLGPVGEHTRGTTKLAARGLARTRTRTAAVVTAVAVAGAVAMVAGTAVASIAPSGSDPGTPGLADNVVMVTTYGQPGPQTRPGGPGVDDNAVPLVPPVPAAVEGRIRAVLPGVELTRLRYAAAGSSSPYDSAGVGPGPDRILLADETVVDLLELSARDREQLESVGAVALFSAAVYNGGSLTRRLTVDGRAMDLEVGQVQDRVANFQLAGFDQTLITEARALELGVPTAEGGLVALSPSPLSSEQQRQLGDLRNQGSQGNPFVPATEAALVGGTFVDIQWSSHGFEVSQNVLEALAVAVALVLTLVVVAIGLALAAAEGRDERDVLVAVGAKPSAMRRFAGAKAWWMTALGGVLAVPVGFVPFAVVFTAQADHEPLRFPWAVASSLVLITPAVAAIMAWAGSSVAQRVRPVRMSTLAVD